MKKFYFTYMVGLLLSAMMLGFSGCSDDDEEGTSGSSSELVGTWQSVRLSGYEKEDGEIIDEWNEEDSDLKIVFSEDGTFESYERWSNEWHREGYVGTWQYKGGKIEITYEEEGYTYKESATVKTLTASKLVVEYLDKYSEDGTNYEDYSLEEYKKIAN